jgi:hypothetical protein
MDARARLRLRNWRDSGDPEDQAAAIREAVRYGKLDPKMVQLAAFLGHPAGRLVADDARGGGGGVVINGKLARNGEMSELAECMSYFGPAAVRRINLGLVRMAFATRLPGEVRISPNVRERRYFYPEAKHLGGLRVIPLITHDRRWSADSTAYEQHGTVGVFEWFRLMTEATNGNEQSLKRLKGIYNEAQPAERWYSYYNRLRPNLVANLAHESMVTRSRNKVLKYCNGFYDDENMLKFMRAEVYPWALGEFAEDVTTPEFVAFPPYVVPPTT